MEMETFLAVTPAHRAAALEHTPHLAHIAYHIGAQSTLLRRDAPGRGGLLCISDPEAHPIEDTEKLCAAVLRECKRQNFSGIVADLEGDPTPRRRAFLRCLDAACGALTLYVPRPYAADAPSAVVLVSSAISGGDLRTYLSGLCRSGRRLALDIERLRMEFPLPCPGGVGTPLSREQLERCMGSPTFFSPQLCARYFTYRENGTARFVLFDDAETMNRKAAIARELGFAAAFYMWTEVSDLAPGLHWK